MPQVRDAVPADAPRITEIHNESIAARDSTMRRKHQQPAEVTDWIETHDEREAVLVVEEDHSVYGWGVVKRYSDRRGYRFAGETAVYIDRHLVGKRQGWGSALQQALIERARHLDYHHLVARIQSDNELSLALHRKFGYQTVGVQREIGHSNGNWKDVTIMQLVLT